MQRLVILLLVSFFASLSWSARDVSAAQEGNTSFRAVGGVVDYAQVFTPDEKQSLEVFAGQLARRIDTDFFVVGVDDRAEQWSQYRSHFAMVDRVFQTVQAAVSRHFQRDAPLTVLIVFKSSVVLHLRTSRAEIDEALMFRNFYRGTRSAVLRVRQAGERHAAAAVRYLDDFTSAVDAEDRGTVAGAGTDRALFWVFQQSAILGSREIVQHWLVNPAYRMFCATVGLFSGLPLLPTWQMFLLFMGGLYLALDVATYRMKQRFPLAEEAIDKAAAALFTLPLILLFAVSQADIETLLHVSQNFGGDLLSYLNWSSEIEAHSFAIPFTVFGAVALLVLLADIHAAVCKQAILSKPRNGDRGLMAAGARVIGLLRTPILWTGAIVGALSGAAWILSLVIWPGLIAAFFIAVSLARRLITFLDVNAKVDAGDQRGAPARPAVTYSQGGSA